MSHPQAKPAQLSSSRQAPGAASHQAGIRRGSPAFLRVTLALFLGGWVTFANLYSPQPLLPLLAREFHASPATASLAISVTTASLSVFLVIVGAVSDRWGRKNTMTAAILVTSSLAVLTAVSPSFGALLVLRTLQGAALAGLPASAMAYLGDEVHAESAGLAMGLYISGTTIGGMTGRIVTSLVAVASSWRMALAWLGGLSLLCGLAFWLLLPPARNFQPRTQPDEHFLQPLLRHLRLPGSMLVFGMAFLLMGSFVPLYNYMGFELLGPPYFLSQAVVGWIFLVYVVGTFSSAWMGRLADRAGAETVLRASIAVMLTGILVTSGTPLSVKVVGLAIATFGFFGAHSIASSWVARKAQAQRAQASSLYLLFYYVGASVGGWAGGIFWQRLGWNGIVVMLGAQLTLALLLALRLSSAGSREVPAPTMREEEAALAYPPTAS